MGWGANVPGGAESHLAPELLHARHRLQDNGKVENLNTRRNLVDIVKKGEYEALHYHDFTGDGWIKAQANFFAFPDTSATPSQPQSYFGAPECLPAYSLVAAPDFLPKAGQRSVSQCLAARLPSRLLPNVWYKQALSLADQRHAPNLSLDDLPDTIAGSRPNFAKTDVTMTAVVTAPFDSNPPPPPATPRASKDRRSYLPDVAAGMFAPGWDVGLDSKGEDENRVFHMAMYSLGSPFLTDSKLCAALSAFWPAIAPDTTRTYAPDVEPDEEQATIAPLTDQEIGLTGEPPWDGIIGPRLLPGEDSIDYPALDNADYVMQALPRRRFYLKRLAEITTEEYVRRLLSMFRVYKALGVPVDQPCERTDLFKQKAAWTVLSFRPADRSEDLFQQAQSSQPSRAPFFAPGETVDFYDVYRCEQVTPMPRDARRCRVTIQKEGCLPVRHQLFVGEKEILLRFHSEGAWRVAPKVAGL